MSSAELASLNEQLRKGFFLAATSSALASLAPFLPVFSCIMDFVLCSSFPASNFSLSWQQRHVQPSGKSVYCGYNPDYNFHSTHKRQRSIRREGSESGRGRGGKQTPVLRGVRELRMRLRSFLERPDQHGLIEHVCPSSYQYQQTEHRD